MNIQVHIEDHIVDLVDDDNDISSFSGGFLNSPKFVILAKHLGVTNLYVSPVLWPCFRCQDFLLGLVFRF